MSAQCAILRQELKVWESQFSAANGGRKAGRADIKASGDIALRYKEYNRLRDILNGKVKQPQSPKRPRSSTETHDVGTPPKKRNTGSAAPAATPMKSTPKKENETHHTPGSESKLFTPVHKKLMISPTPQKDGIVLGIFDLLPSETPSKLRIVMGEIEPNLMQTPQKANGTNEDELLSSGKLCDKTPMSEGRRFMLDQFVTPSKRKRADEPGTPTSARGGATPSFLRRDFRIMETVDEEHHSPKMRKPRSFMRSLKAERQAESPAPDADFDDDEEALRELEQESAAPAAPSKKTNEVLVEDSQVAMKLGADGEGMSDVEDDGKELGPDGQPRRIWKKRGQKRQTKRVIMRPVFSKPKAPGPQLETIQSEDELDTEGNIPETQHDDEDYDSSADSDYSNASHSTKKRKTQQQQNAKSGPKTATVQQENTAGKESTVKKVAKKISASAHANFRRLKIKNKNSKAGGAGGRGSWGRGRR
ncbi:hypothetical protein K490DRAFT_39690 [Saccharata proteae CBS 121410]|uniref:DNA replication regulator SLD2 n=1 Tax=Saccharata proteae CBS 121410 TaxID=1314787 RepID=A0A9P4LZT9_9PEZI|nr:hypothetical protein K490DRAFT_39690 [Saccharata proteae CBS 121410]